MRIAVVFDTPWADWSPADHWQQMEKEIAAWDQEEPDMEYQIADALRQLGEEVHLIGVHDDIQCLAPALAECKPDLVFNGAESFHGKAELDYLFPALIDAEGYRYTGSSPTALLVTRNKAMSKKVLAYHGIKVPGFATWRPGEKIVLPGDLHFPLFVKPLQTDASAGIAQASVVTDLAALVERVTFVHERFRQPAIAEEFIDGRELYVSVIGNGDSLELLPITEMVFDHSKTLPEERIATQYAKWDESYRKRKGIRNVFARPIAKAVRKTIEEICRTAQRALWLQDYARLDLRLTKDNQVWLIEANANPFLSWGHDVANAAEKAGMPYTALIRRILTEAVARYDV
ncbi:MAG: D-alanine--D-alanine ligase [Gemmatimonadota bacterium]